MNSKLRDILENLSAYIATNTIQGYQERRKYDDTKVAEAEKAIRQAVGEEMLELVGSVQEYDEGDGWDIVFSQADAKNAEGKVIKKGKKRSCCPGDDIAYVRNMTIAELRQKIKQWQGGEDE